MASNIRKHLMARWRSNRDGYDGFGGYYRYPGGRYQDTVRYDPRVFIRIIDHGS